LRYGCSDVTFVWENEESHVVYRPPLYGASLVELGTMYNNLINVVAGWYDKRIRTELAEEQPTEIC
jgi:hypothetical protein